MPHERDNAERALRMLQDSGILAPDLTLDRLMAASTDLSQNARELAAAEAVPTWWTIPLPGGDHILVDTEGIYIHPPHRAVDEVS